MAEYIAPARSLDGYNCPFCGAYAQQHDLDVSYTKNGRYVEPEGTKWEAAKICDRCRKRTLWYGEKMTLPIGSAAPLPNDDMPADIKSDYLEAREIANLSPRGGAALLRLAIQKLCVHLGEPGKDINTDIGSLVNKGLPVRVQQALDIVRVIGNESVHPGTIDLSDNPDTVNQLFVLVNLIVQIMISEPKAVDAMFNSLPPNKLQGIANRDK